mgnify:CR=1 FL=1
MFYAPYIPLQTTSALMNCLKASDIKNINWSPWFAWYPVKVQSGTWTWLETVYTRKRRVCISRKPINSPGMFKSKVRLKGRVYINKVDHVYERLVKPDGFVGDLIDILGNHKEGTFVIK